MENNLLVLFLPKISKFTVYGTCETLRIYHECMGRIEKSVPRFAVWPHKACRVMINGDPEGRIFLSYPHTNNRFFILLITVFIDVF